MKRTDTNAAATTAGVSNPPYIARSSIKYVMLMNKNHFLFFASLLAVTGSLAKYH
jgi:hypothetical protein